MALIILFSSLLFFASCQRPASSLSDRNSLFAKYDEVFPHSNRNAASHRWATYILERSANLTEKSMRDLFAGFCPISGSPLSYDRSELRINMTLPMMSGGNASGMMYFCCWPCACDSQDFLKVDTKTVMTADGERQYQFVVIGNPCKNQKAIPQQAPDVNCEADRLVKATISDHGYVIIGMFFEPGVKDHSDALVQSTDQSAFSGKCQARSDAGHNSGMGMIFREVAGITPIQSAMQMQPKGNRTAEGSDDDKAMYITTTAGADSGTVKPSSSSNAGLACSINSVLIALIHVATRIV